MGDNDQGIVTVTVHFLKYLNQVVKAPQVNAGFRLVKDGEGRVAGDDGGDFNPFQLSAGKTGIHVAVHIIPGA